MAHFNALIIKQLGEEYSVFQEKTAFYRQELRNACISAKEDVACESSELPYMYVSEAIIIKPIIHNDLFSKEINVGKSFKLELTREEFERIAASQLDYIVKKIDAFVKRYDFKPEHFIATVSVPISKICAAIFLAKNGFVLRKNLKVSKKSEYLM